MPFFVVVKLFTVIINVYDNVTYYNPNENGKNKIKTHQNNNSSYHSN